MPPTTITTITQTNSTTYADEVGIQIGLPRLPGETSDAYVKRLNTATRVDTSQDYIGLLNEITLQLGLNIGYVISLVSAIQTWQPTTDYLVGAFVLDSNGNVEQVTAIAGMGQSGFTAPAWNTTVDGTTVDDAGANQITWTNMGPDIITVNIALNGIVITDTITQNTQTVPVVLVDIDDAWTWYQLSDIVAAINAGTVAVATLLGSDGPALKISRQSNVITVIGQTISGQNVNLGFTGILVDSILFNVPVPTYTANTNGTIVFSAPVPSGTQITYQRVVWPYNIIGGDVAILSLLDSAVQQMAQGPNGTMVYQVQQVVQAIVSQDKSYWAE